MKQTINEQVSRIKGMMGINESSLNDMDFQDAVDTHNSRSRKILELRKLVEHLFGHGYINRDEFHDLRVVYDRIDKRRHDEINNYYTPKDNEDENPTRDIPGFEGMMDDLDNLTIRK